ncbi:MAG: HlyD family efflux transporter periplasmic adaptor subunit [Thiovulaceae bacterium]|nr:HlyD family efflux transporter periplasmic adaptor subunit [Sulfurimonadaceae bacterium]MCW9026163.1 HlyD family efflux transporter periplasmic adaptor subunit [Sulfurimonadaceae bacterium]
MKLLAILLFSIATVFANEYYAKVEPIEIRNISSNVSGLVVYADEKNLGKLLSSEIYVKIDSKLDEKELKYIKDKLEYLRNTVATNEKVVKNLESSLVRKRKNYEMVEALKIKSQVEKDREYYDLIASENQLLSTKKEIQSLKIQITDLKLRRAVLRRSVNDKNLVADGFILYELNVKPGQVVNMSTPLAKVADISKAKLTIYLNRDDLVNPKKKTIYLDGKKTPYKISRIVNIADSKNISKYMAQIIIDSPKIFSNLVKVELKDE